MATVTFGAICTQGICNDLIVPLIAPVPLNAGLPDKANLTRRLIQLAGPSRRFILCADRLDAGKISTGFDSGQRSGTYRWNYIDIEAPMPVETRIDPVPRDDGVDRMN